MRTTYNTLMIKEDLFYYMHKNNPSEVRADCYRQLGEIGKCIEFIPQTIGDQNWLFFDSEEVDKDKLIEFCEEDNCFVFEEVDQDTLDWWLNGIRNTKGRDTCFKVKEDYNPRELSLVVNGTKVTGKYEDE